MKVLITGITGFAGSHLAEYLLTRNDYTIVGTHVSDRNLSNIDRIKDNITLKKINLLDADNVTQLIHEIKPDVIFHLAASTSVAESFENPLNVIMNNTASELHVLEAVKNAELKDTKVVVTSSAHVYGIVAEKDLPIGETVQFMPDSAYSISKITQDYLALQYFLAYKVRTIRLRPFNHAGARLSPTLSLSRFAKLIAEIEKGKQEPVLKVGNMEAKRDFTDVRDMVRAYVLASEKCVDGEAYNIGTGTSHTMQELLALLLSFAKVKITVEQDQSLFRPSDIPELRCDATKFIEATGWKAEIPIEKTLQDTLDYWRRMV